MTGDGSDWVTTTAADVHLQNGRNRIRIAVDQGGFNLKSLTISRQ